MSRPHVEVWTDGSGTVTGEPGGWACILRFKKGDEWVERVHSGCEEFTTSQRMEITAALEALKALKKPCRVTIHTDSQYVAFAIKKGWVYKWRKRGWPSKVKNADLWKQVMPLLWKHEVTMFWVRGHNGTEHNERCDQLAGEERAALMEQLASVGSF
jgi:ribonuclease HI